MALVKVFSLGDNEKGKSQKFFLERAEKERESLERRKI